MADLRKFFKKTRPAVQEKKEEGLGIPRGLWVKCPKCGETVYKDEVRLCAYTCPKCGGLFRIKAGTRIRMLADEGSFEEWFAYLPGKNPLDYPGYPEKLSQLQDKLHMDEAVRIGKAEIGGISTVLGVMDARFLMGSMGYAVGEKITRAFERATEEKLPVVLFCCSGGARMQEGMISLMQMAKTAAAIGKHSERGLFYLSVLTDPTMGGVTASFAMLGDIILAEPEALVGFAGPRVIAQTIGQKLPEGFQRAEFLLEHGLIDAVVERAELRERIALLLRMHEQPLEKEKMSGHRSREDSEEACEDTQATAWERVLAARDSTRPVSTDYIEAIFQDFTELHGDRCFRDDGSIVGGIARLEERSVTVIGVQKGRSTKENVKRNFGMPFPEGYRKALRLMKQAEKFGRPVICFVDTPGAFCGMEAEERGQGGAIAQNLLEMAALKVPVLSIVTGEGGSGGALALAAANEVWMLENASYTILSPEGFASILWKDSSRASEAAEIMKVTARELKEMGIIDQVIPEHMPADAQSLPALALYLKERIRLFLEKEAPKTPEELSRERYQRFRAY